ncbi:MAG: 50S ribosomal protein L18 [Candidatus Colwellbacteria bacterium]
MANPIRQTRILRQRRVRAQIRGTATKPRLAVFRSNRNIELQLIDDTEGKTLVSVTSQEMDGKGSKTEKATVAGKTLAKKALEANIKEAVFDRRHYRYHGRVKAVAEGAREGGLKI